MRPASVARKLAAIRSFFHYLCRERVVADNPDEGLRQGMPVTVTLDTSKPPPERGQGSGS